MNLFERFIINTKCTLCGCTVNNSSSQSSSELPDFLRSHAALICPYCHLRLPFAESSCFTCGLPLSSGFSSTDENMFIGGNCGRCLANSPNYDRTISAFHYEYPINDFISRLKYNAQLQYLPLLSSYMIRAIKNAYQQTNIPELIIPVPLHKKKLSQRGFNQSSLLAKQIAKNLPLNVFYKGVERTKVTQAQSGLDSNERKSNVKGAFQISTELPPHVAIVDDVVTTGMTVSELTTQAKLAGALKVDIWCVARAYEL